MLFVYGSRPARASEIVVGVGTVFAGIAGYERSVIVERTARDREAAMCGHLSQRGVRTRKANRFATA